jgi:phosphate acyltransferase
MLTTIAVDAMGGDNAPAVEIQGAIQAARDLRARVLLVGQEDVIRAELARQGIDNPRKQRLHLEIVHASEVVTMTEPVAQAVRRKRDSSIRVAARLVREGKAHGLVSAGNTGAVMMTAKLVLGTLPSVDRPALAGIFPTLKGRGTVLLDVGANAECKSEHLKQFAVMGSVYSRHILGVSEPKVGLMSIGEEDVKGNDLTKETLHLLREAPINFVGNVEGRDIFTGDVDVIVCDGFTGNVILKTSEGLVEAIMTAAQRTGADLLDAGGRVALAHGLQKRQEAVGLLRTGRRAFARREAVDGDLPRQFDSQSDSQCHSHCQRVLQRQTQRAYRRRAERSRRQQVIVSRHPAHTGATPRQTDL